MYVLQVRRLGCGLARAETDGPLDFHTPCPFGKSDQDRGCMSCMHHFERIEHQRAVSDEQAAAIVGAL